MSTTVGKIERMTIHGADETPEGQMHERGNVYFSLRGNPKIFMFMYDRAEWASFMIGVTGSMVVGKDVQLEHEPFPRSHYEQVTKMTWQVD